MITVFETKTYANYPKPRHWTKSFVRMPRWFLFVPFYDICHRTDEVCDGRFGSFHVWRDICEPPWCLNACRPCMLMRLCMSVSVPYSSVSRCIPPSHAVYVTLSLSCACHLSPVDWHTRFETASWMEQVMTLILKRLTGDWTYGRQNIRTY